MRTDLSRSDLARSVLTAPLSNPRPAVTCCTVTGEVDLLTAPVLREQLTKAADARCLKVTVDLTAVTYFAAVGAGVLAEAQSSYGEERDLVVVGARAQVCKVLDVCRLGCARYATFEQALANMGGEPAVR